MLRHALRIASLGIALVAIATPASAAVDGTDCGCTATGAYLVPDPGVRPAVGTINATFSVITSPGGRHRLVRLGSNPQDPWRVERVSNGQVLHPGIAANNFTWSPDDDRLATNRQDATALQYFSLFDLTDLSVNGRAREIWTLGGPVWASARHRFSDDGSSYLFAGARNVNQLTIHVVDIPTRAVHAVGPFVAATLPADIDADLPENFGAPSNPSIAGWGWGPDATRFVYSWRTGTSPSEFAQTLVNVRTGSSATRYQNYPSARWGFSPCGDVFGIVFRRLFTDPGASALLYDTFAPSTNAIAPERAFAFATVELGTNATSHFGLLGGAETPIASNIADDACPVANQDPTALFTPPATLYAGAPARFTDTSSDPDGTVVAWSWAFGDGGTSNDRNPEHTYAAVGTYTVRLTVTDDDGATGTTTRTVQVVDPPNQPPVADFAPPAAPRAGQPAAFANTSTDADGTIVSHAWEFGDGQTSTDANPVHVYAEPGEYTVTLTVIDDEGASDTRSRTFRVCGSVGTASGKLLFGDGQFGFDADLLVLNTPAQSFVRITQNSIGTLSGGAHARWSPDGTRIVYVHSNNFTAGLYLMNADGTNRRQILTGPGFLEPRWTPDGQWIAFTNDAAPSIPGSIGERGIYFVRPDGTGLVRAANQLLEDVSPVIDATCAATAAAQRTPACYTLLRFRPRPIFTADFEEVSTIRGDGSGVRVLLRDTSRRGIYQPRFSPSGEKIAFLSWLGDYDPIRFQPLYSIYVSNAPSAPDTIDFDPRLQLPLVRAATLRELGGVVWSPDGRELAFSDASADLTLTDAGGCDVQRVPGQPGGYLFPLDWEPGTATQALASVQGTIYVVDSPSDSYTPAAGAVVEINGGGIHRTTTTDANGRYSFTGLPNGVIWGVRLLSVPGARVGFEYRNVEPELTGSADGVNLFGATGTVQISGRVVTAPVFGSGAPLAGVTVRAEAPGFSAQAVTDADGRYRLAVPVVGTYSLTAELAGYGFTPRKQDVTVGSIRVELADIAARERAEGFVAFTSSRDGSDEIYVSELDGGYERNLTNDLANDAEPAVSPDGARIAFASDRDGSWRIYVTDLTGLDVRAVEETAGSGTPLEGREPAWSFDGARLAVATPNGLRIVRFDGAPPQDVTSDPRDASPAFDPSGTRLYFERGVHEGAGTLVQVNLYEVDLAQSPPVETLIGIGVGGVLFVGDPAAKPDGSALAYTYDDLTPEGGIMAVRDGTGRITAEFGGRDPAWSPDGLSLAGTRSFSDGQSFLFWTTADGVRSQVFTTSGADREPSWGPGSLEPECDNARDDDGDGDVDLADGGCDWANDTSERGVLVCDDGVDADGDGFVGFPQDPGCSDVYDFDESDARFACDDGFDNDGDGLTDMADPGCPLPQATPEDPPCDNGIDDDGNGLTDSDDPDCSPGWPYGERKPACGLGAEIALALGSIARLRRRSRRLVPM
jgi:Tol biopolymer transport system component/chitodextrinase